MHFEASVSALKNEYIFFVVVVLKYIYIYKQIKQEAFTAIRAKKSRGGGHVW